MLLSQVVNLFSQLFNAFLFFFYLPFGVLRLPLIHEDLGAVLLCLADCSHCTGLLFIEHPSQLACLRLATLFLLLVEFLQLLILAVLVHHSVLESVVLVTKGGQLVCQLIKFALLDVGIVLDGFDLLTKLCPFCLRALLDLI